MIEMRNEVAELENWIHNLKGTEMERKKLNETVNLMVVRLTLKIKLNKQVSSRS